MDWTALWQKMAETVGSRTNCTICFEELNNPRFLPCHHTFCFQCIENLRSSHRSGKVPCPLCRSPFNNVSAAGLKTNVFAEELVSLSRESRGMKVQLEKVAGDLDRTKDQLDKRANELAVAKNDVAKMAKMADDLKTAVVQLDEAKSQREAERCRLNAELRKARTSLAEKESKSQREKRLTSRVEKLERSLADAEGRKLGLIVEKREVEEELAGTKQDLEAAMKGERMARARAQSDLEKMRRELASAKFQTSAAEAARIEAVSEVQRLDRALEDTRNLLEKSQAEAMLNVLEKSEVESRHRDMAERLRNSERRLAAAKTELVASKRAHSDSEQALTEAKSSYRDLQV